MAPRIDVIIGAKTEEFARGVKGVVGKLNTIIPTELKGMLGRTLATGFVVGFARNIMAASDRIKDMADRTGISIQRIQELKFAADQTGSSIEGFATSYRALVMAQQDALAAGPGGNEQFRAFEQIGISIGELRQLSPEQLFLRVGDAIQKGSGSAEEMNAAFTVLGRSAMEVLPSMKEGLRQLGEQARSSGVIIKTELVEQLARANDEWDRNVAYGKAKAAGPVGAGIGLVDWMTTAIRGLGPSAKSWYHSFTGNAAGYQRDVEEFNKLWEEFGQRYGGDVGGSYSSTADPRVMAIINRGRRKGVATATATGEMFGPPAPEKTTAESMPLQLPAADALQRIGLFRGGFDPAQSTRQQQLSTLRQMDDHLRSMVRLLREE